MSHPPMPTGAAGLLVDPNQQLTFTWEGRTIPAFAGQSIGAALYAVGVRIFTRSFKYHRPRGLFCVAGECPNCLMQVDDRPNVRTCIEPVRQGQVVRHQNAWPSLDFDVLRIFDKMARWLPVGFYYKRFHKPRWLWPLFEYVIRHVAGLGRIDVNVVPHVDATVSHLHAEVCVVGGGPAGMAAAKEAADAGADVLVLDRQPRLGGHLLFDRTEPLDSEGAAAALRSLAKVRILCDVHVFGLYESNLLGAFQGNRFLKIRTKQTVICTGGRQRPFVFPNNDLPGIFLGRGVLRLAELYGVQAGRRAVVLTDSDDGVRLAQRLNALHIEVVAVVDVRRPEYVTRPVSGPWLAEGVSPPVAAPWQTLTSSVVLGAEGDSRLRAVRVASVDSSGRADLRSGQEIACDLLCLASELVPANELLLQGGMCFRCENGRQLPDHEVPGLFAAGAAAGEMNVCRQILQGKLRGAEAAAALGYAVPALDGYRRELENAQAAVAPPPSKSLCPETDSRLGKRFVCLCEDVTQKDLEQAVAEGFSGMETLKRYSTATMGPCQGKVCQQASIEVCAQASNRDSRDVGMTTSRPPAVPVELGVLAAWGHHPVRRTPLHHWHEAAGAKWLDAGLWKRPESYGDPAAEVRNVRTAVGLIDVSTLGKIEVVGPDAAELLERIYLNHWADLKIGRVRYGAMCTEEGILFDDGVGARLGPDRFYLTATTGNAEAVVEWLRLWQATWQLNAAVLEQTSALAAMNLAGPHARDVLQPLTALDLSRAAFPYMAFREAEVAGIPCRLFRIGFVGELGYEIHCPSAYAWHLWEALNVAGAGFRIKPFGVEAQRILRLEKGHLIIGQDTDALSNPLEAGLEWLVRFRKQFFHGRQPLLRLKSMGPRSRLVGFMPVNSNRVPPEGSQVVEQGRPVGRITSARFSPTLGKSLGLAWVPATTAVAGRRFFIHWNGTDVPAEIVTLPFYDPEGKRLRA